MIGFVFALLYVIFRIESENVKETKATEYAARWRRSTEGRAERKASLSFKNS